MGPTFPPRTDCSVGCAKYLFYLKLHTSSVSFYFLGNQLVVVVQISRLNPSKDTCRHDCAGRTDNRPVQLPRLTARQTNIDVRRQTDEVQTDRQTSCLSVYLSWSPAGDRQTDEVQTDSLSVCASAPPSSRQTDR